MTITLNGTTGITTPDITSAAGLDAADLTGTIASARLPAGSVIQVVYGSAGTQVESAYSSATDLGLSVSITPSSASSKILVIVQCAGCGSRGTGTSWRITLRRNSTNLINFATYIGSQTIAGVETYPNTVYLDSPSTTSAISYNLSGFRTAGADNCYFNHSDGTAVSTMVAMEIAA